MAKVSFTKLNLKCDQEIDIFWNNEMITIKTYLPMEEKLTLVSNVINQSIDDNGYYNPMKIKVFLTLEIMYAYTNINFTEKMKENPLKTYDAIVGSGLFDLVQTNIGVAEVEQLINGVDETIKSIYSYKNSVMGILDNISKDYSNLSLDASKIQKELADPENMELLRAVLTKLG